MIDRRTIALSAEICELRPDVDVPITDAAGHQLVSAHGNWHMMASNIATGENGVERAQKLVHALRRGSTPFTEPVVIGRALLSDQCALCGERVGFVTDGMTMWPESPCKYKDGVPYRFEVAWPSGRVAVANYFFVGFDDIRVPDIETAAGKLKYSLAHAAVGCLRVPVGNSCPSIYRQGDGNDTFIIANEGGSWRSEYRNPPEGEHLMQVVTDVGEVSMADDETWRSRGGGDDSVDNPTVINVRPGVYLVTHHMYEPGFLQAKEDPDNLAPTVYTTITWVRDC